MASPSLERTRHLRAGRQDYLSLDKEALHAICMSVGLSSRPFSTYTAAQSWRNAKIRSEISTTSVTRTRRIRRRSVGVTGSWDISPCLACSPPITRSAQTGVREDQNYLAYPESFISPHTTWAHNTRTTCSCKRELKLPPVNCSPSTAASFPRVGARRVVADSSFRHESPPDHDESQKLRSSITPPRTNES